MLIHKHYTEDQVTSKLDNFMLLNSQTAPQATTSRLIQISNWTACGITVADLNHEIRADANTNMVEKPKAKKIPNISAFLKDGSIPSKRSKSQRRQRRHFQRASRKLNYLLGCDVHAKGSWKYKLAAITWVQNHHRADTSTESKEFLFRRYICLSYELSYLLSSFD